MISDFKTLSENSRIWIYQSNRSLTQKEKENEIHVMDIAELIAQTQEL